MEIYRRAHPAYRNPLGDASNGYFEIPSRGLRIIASNGSGWDHVSVSLADRCPTWDEMQFVRTMFFLPEETVVQIHPPLDRHVNVHPYCLHLWRNQSESIELPPSWMLA
jgi:hypothetical protein